MRSFFIKTFIVLLLLGYAILLTGCAKQTPTQNIIEHHVELVNNALNNPHLTDEAKEALKACRAGLLSAEESHVTEINRCESDIRYWKTVSSFLAILIVLYIGFKVMKR